MDNNIVPPAPAPDTGAPPAPPPAPPVAPAAPVQPAAPSSSYSSGGSLFSQVSLVGVGIVMLTTVTLLCAIYYYRTSIKNMKTGKSQDRKDIDEIKGNLQAVMGESYKSY